MNENGRVDREMDFIPMRMPLSVKRAVEVFDGGMMIYFIHPCYTEPCCLIFRWYLFLCWLWLYSHKGIPDVESSYFLSCTVEQSDRLVKRQTILNLMRLWLDFSSDEGILAWCGARDMHLRSVLGDVRCLTFVMQSWLVVKRDRWRWDGRRWPMLHYFSLSTWQSLYFEHLWTWISESGMPILLVHEYRRLEYWV